MAMADTDRPGTLLYKCQVCGVVFDGKPIESLRKAFFARWAHRVDYTTLHVCMDGRWGIGKLVGRKPDAEQGSSTE